MFFVLGPHSAANILQFDPTLFALNVIVKIPLPTNTALVTPSVLTGKTKCASVTTNAIMTLAIAMTIAMMLLRPQSSTRHDLCFCRYEPENHQLLWKVKRFPGGAEYSFSAEVELSARIDDKKTWNRPPISMDFQVMFAVLAAVSAAAAAVVVVSHIVYFFNLIAGANVHSQRSSSALFEDHREEQLPDGTEPRFHFPVLRVNLGFSGQVGEVHHQERRVPVQGLGSPSTCAKFCCVKEVSGISKSLITFLILTAAAPESLPCGNSVREADQLVIAC